VRESRRPTFAEGEDRLIENPYHSPEAHGPYMEQIDAHLSELLATGA
jgi:hypothetical protein